MFMQSSNTDRCSGCGAPLGRSNSGWRRVCSYCGSEQSAALNNPNERIAAELAIKRIEPILRKASDHELQARRTLEQAKHSNEAASAELEQATRSTPPRFSLRNHVPLDVFGARIALFSFYGFLYWLLWMALSLSNLGWLLILLAVAIARHAAIFFRNEIGAVKSYYSEKKSFPANRASRIARARSTLQATTARIPELEREYAALSERRRLLERELSDAQLILGTNSLSAKERHSVAELRSNEVGSQGLERFAEMFQAAVSGARI